jgi:hypothetical protein
MNNRVSGGTDAEQERGQKGHLPVVVKVVSYKVQKLPLQIH